MQYRLVGILDTRTPGSKHGIKHKCEVSGCHKSSQIWVCLQGQEVVDNGPDRPLAITLTEDRLVVGTCCCKKLIKNAKFPIWAEHKALAALEESPINITSRKGQKLFEEFKG